MIYTITFSPSLDYVMNVDLLKLGEVNRSKKEDYIAGGKGINVSIMLNHLGEESIAMGFIGGFIGDYIQSSLNNIGIKTDFVHIDGNSRINVKINSSDTETAVNGNGPIIPQEKINQLFEKIKSISSGDILIISGSVPNSLPENIYENILSLCKQKNIKTVVDCEKLLLLNSLKYNPFLIKPNQSEMEQIFNQKLDSIEIIKEKCLHLQSLGAKNIIVSLGEKGAFMLTSDNQSFFVPAPTINLVSSVGSGDSLVAGFVYMFKKSKDYLKSLKFAVACGTASASIPYIASKELVLSFRSFFEK